MNIIVSKSSLKLSNFIVVGSLCDISSIVGEIGYLVYHDSNDSSQDKIKYLLELSYRVTKLVYIRDIDKVEPFIKLLTLGLENGYYTDNEYCLNDESNLLEIINSLSKEGMIELTGLNVIKDFFNDNLNTISNTYKLIIENSIKSITSEYNQYQDDLNAMSLDVSRVFSEIISGMEGTKKELSEAKSELERMSKERKFSGSMNSMIYFPQITNLKFKDIIKVKEIDDCLYLTTFMMGLREYLEKIKYISAKLVFVVPQGTIYQQKYADYTWIVQENYRTMESYYEKVIFTNFPSKDVIDRLLDDSNSDTIILVDRLKTNTQHILNNRKGNILYGVCGSSSIENFRLDSKYCINSMQGTLGSIPYIPNLPKDIGLKSQILLNELSVMYEGILKLYK